MYDILPGQEVIPMADYEREETHLLQLWGEVGHENANPDQE